MKVNELLAAVCSRTGLDEFEDDSFREGIKQF